MDPPDGAPTSEMAASAAASGGGSITVTVPKASVGSSTCVRLALDGWTKGRLELFLPTKTQGGDVFEPGRSVVHEAGSGNTITMVLPDYVRGRAIKITLPGGAHIASLEFGERPRLQRDAVADGERDR